MAPRIINTQGRNGMAQPSLKKTVPLNGASHEEIPLNSLPAHEDQRAKFYKGDERLKLQGEHVKRVRDLQEENDRLQREIISREKELMHTKDALSILADIEHMRTMIARNTGEILKIYSKNEERLKRIADLESQNAQLQSDLMNIQGKFVSINNMDDRTKFASEFFFIKSTIEKNLQEIEDLSRN